MTDKTVSVVELSREIFSAIDKLSVAREVTLVHGSALTESVRANSDLDVLILSAQSSPHKKYTLISGAGRVIDVNVFSPSFMMHAVIGQRRRGERTLAGMIVNGTTIESNADLSVFFSQVKDIYRGNLVAFPSDEYAGRLCSIMNKITARSGDPVNFLLLSEAYSLIASSWLWSRGQWICTGAFLAKALREFDVRYYERLNSAYLLDVQQADCKTLLILASELFEGFGGLRHHSNESSYFE